jgi:hypothetical protein
MIIPFLNPELLDHWSVCMRITVWPWQLKDSRSTVRWQCTCTRANVRRQSFIRSPSNQFLSKYIPNDLKSVRYTLIRICLMINLVTQKHFWPVNKNVTFHRQVRIASARSIVSRYKRVGCKSLTRNVFMTAYIKAMVKRLHPFWVQHERWQRLSSFYESQ